MSVLCCVSPTLAENTTARTGSDIAICTLMWMHWRPMRHKTLVMEKNRPRRGGLLDKLPAYVRQVPSPTSAFSLQHLLDHRELGFELFS